MSFTTTDPRTGCDTEGLYYPAASNFQEALADISGESDALLIQKHEDYGPNNIMRSPFGPARGLVTRIYDKVARLANILDSDRLANFESLEDTWMDIRNYAQIGLMVERGTFTLPLAPDFEQDQDEPLDFDPLYEEYLAKERAQALVTEGECSSGCPMCAEELETMRADMRADPTDLEPLRTEFELDEDWEATRPPEPQDYPTLEECLFYQWQDEHIEELLRLSVIEAVLQAAFPLWEVTTL